ncbi:MAG: porin [Elusimicrobia bacterium]|nr:porin [Elusimicrobiota bacterium]
MKRKYIMIGCGVLLGLGAVAARAAEQDDRLSALEARQKALEDKVAAQPVVTAGKEGFAIKSADGAFGLKFFGDVQVDGRFYLVDNAGSFSDTILVRRLRPTFEMSGFGVLTARFQPNFGGSTYTLDDAYLDYKAAPGLIFRAGRYKPPVGLENLQSSVRTTFVERSLATNLVPVYDVGAQLGGGLIDGRVNYAFSLSNGAPDGETVTGDSADGKEVSGRLFFQPWKGSKSLLSDLGVGVSGTSGSESGATTTNKKLPAGFKTEGLNTFFTYKYAVAQGKHQRVSPQLYWYGSNMGVLGEYVVSYQHVRSTTTSNLVSLANQAWQVAASFVLTGETPGYKGLKPAKDFSPSKGQWGAVELAGRVSRFTVDEDAFDSTNILSDPNVSAREARALTGGVNWYPNAFVKAMVNYTYTSFSGGATNGNRVPERALFLRTQLAF